MNNLVEIGLPIIYIFAGAVIGFVIGRTRTLTKRELLAAKALQGILANEKFAGLDEAVVAGVALKNTDALLERLRG
jgi:hypothetical protein